MQNVIVLRGMKGFTGCYFYGTDVKSFNESLNGLPGRGIIKSLSLRRVSRGLKMHIEMLTRVDYASETTTDKSSHWAFGISVVKTVLGIV